MTYEEIKKNYDESYNKVMKVRDELYDSTSSYQEFCDKYYASQEFDEFEKWDLLETLNRTPRMRVVIDEWEKDCRFTFDDFMETVKTGFISSWDGSGYYGNENEVSDISINIRQMRKGNYRKDFTHIYWYNKWKIY